MPAIHILVNTDDPDLEPKAQPGETIGEYTDYLIMKGKKAGKNRQCSIGWHEECSDPYGHSCKCSCHSGAQG